MRFSNQLTDKNEGKYSQVSTDQCGLYLQETNVCEWRSQSLFTPLFFHR